MSWWCADCCSSPRFIFWHVFFKSSVLTSCLFIISTTEPRGPLLIWCSVRAWRNEYKTITKFITHFVHEYMRVALFLWSLLRWLALSKSTSLACCKLIFVGLLYLLWFGSMGSLLLRISVNITYTQYQIIDVLHRNITQLHSFIHIIFLFPILMAFMNYEQYICKYWGFEFKIQFLFSKLVRIFSNNELYSFSTKQAHIVHQNEPIFSNKLKMTFIIIT